MSKIKLLEVPGEACLFVLEGPLEESDSEVIAIPQDQIEKILDPDKTPELELVSAELALALRRHMLQEEIAFYEDRKNLERAIRRAEEFPDVSQSRKEIEAEWNDSLEHLKLMLNEMTESAEEEKNEGLYTQRNPANWGNLRRT